MVSGEGCAGDQVGQHRVKRCVAVEFLRGNILVIFPRRIEVFVGVVVLAPFHHVSLRRGFPSNNVSIRYGSTLYSAIMPACMCSSKWQWYIQVPGSSGTMSTVSIWAGPMKITSVRLPASSTTLPCQ